MPIKQRYASLVIFTGTLAEFNASTRKWPKGALLMPSDSPQIRYGTGTALFSALFSMPGQALQQATLIAALAASTDLPATAATYADLAAARTSVEALRAGAEPRLDNLEAKVAEIISKFKTAGLIALT